MTSEQAVRTIIEKCTDLGIPFMIVGSLSSNYHGIERSTKDADFVVELKPDQLRSLADQLKPTFQLNPQPIFESVTLTTRYIFTVANLDYEIELFVLSDDPHDQERFRRRIRVDVYGRNGWVATAEDVIVMKLRWYHVNPRSKDWDDVRNVIAVQQNRLDWDYIYRWCDLHGSREHLNAIRKSLESVNL
ncbi:MAG TPA: hypothetical protein VKD71_00570 [Gemmataceae bacterium]|nr:hypothetical protein [Gemmataceae bacterium]